MKRYELVLTELRRTVRNPARIRKFNWGRVRFKTAQFRAGQPGFGEDGQRPYRSYDAYVRHQRSKVGAMDLTDYNPRFQQVLRERLTPHADWLAGSNVLCLAARQGAEVRAFHDHGAFAVGIDLEPGDRNGLVLPGDFHHLQFPTGCVDAVYTNSLDHALDLDAVAAEARRVVRDGGKLFIEAVVGTDEGGSFKNWEARTWRCSSDAVTAFEAAGFTRLESTPFDEPWPGVLYVLEG